MSNWFKKTALNPGEVRYRATFPIDIYIDSIGEPSADQEIAYNILVDIFRKSPNVQVDHLCLSDVKLYNDVMREMGLG